jgi:pyruvate kinase
MVYRKVLRVIVFRFDIPANVHCSAYMNLKNKTNYIKITRIFTKTTDICTIMKKRFTRTKIVATVGPASSSPEVLKQLILSGVDTFRLNFSHGTQQSHKEVISHIKRLNAQLNTHVGILADLQGPKIRIGDVENGSITLVPEKEIDITVKQSVCTAQSLFVNYAPFAKEVKPGDLVLLDDGHFILKVLKSNNKDKVRAKIIYGGVLTSRKGVNLPDSEISLPSLTKKDLSDLQFALEQDVNWIALSFVRTAKDITDLKNRIKKSGFEAKVIAKIEKPQAVKNLEDILDVTDAVMIARGDLGVEVPMRDMTIIQKRIVTACINKAKPVIIATQMMQSMIDSPMPTRAEINDVANGIFDGADALMLSAETASGKYPVKVIQVMKDIAERIEHENSIYNKKLVPLVTSKTRLSDAICYNACKIAEDVHAKAIISLSRSGYTAFMISSYRPKADLLVYMDNRKNLNTLNLVWGVRTFFYDKNRTVEDTIDDLKFDLKKQGFVKKNDIVVNTASMPLHWKGSTNMLKVGTVD